MLSDEQLQRAAEILKAGGAVGLPTETVYGLAADAENEIAVRRIFAIKGRPSHHPLIVHLADVDAARSWVTSFPPQAELLARLFWPGPLTLVLPRSSRASDAVTGGQPTVAIRVPRHPVALAVLSRFGGGIAAPSANRFGGVSPTTAEHVRQDLGAQLELILDGGPSQVGIESTIVDLSSDGGPAILRPGAITQSQLEEALGVQVPVREKTDVRVSGSLPSHYAPRAGVVLCSATELGARAQALLDGGQKVATLAPAAVAISPNVRVWQLPDAPAGYAQQLYAALREIDALGFDVIVVVEPEQQGVGIAIHDRLRRAAAPRTG